MKIIFLDINGVIEPFSDFEFFKDRHFRPARKLIEFDRHRNCVRNLNRITDLSGAGIVVSSTMRHLGMDVMSKYFLESGITGKLVGLTPFEIEHRNRLRPNQRDSEILEYLKQNKVSRFLILDDSAYFVTPSLLANFILVDSFRGLDNHVMEASLRHFGIHNYELLYKEN